MRARGSVPSVGRLRILSKTGACQNGRMFPERPDVAMSDDLSGGRLAYCRVPFLRLAKF